MYCRSCYYDLRGNETPRCPECGTEFAFDDPDTFLLKKPGFFMHRLLVLRRHRRAVVLVWTVPLLCLYVAVGREFAHHNRYRIHPSVISSANLKNILAAWMGQQYEHPEQRTFDLQAAKESIRPSYSAWSEYGSAKNKALAQTVLEWGPALIAPTLVYVLVLLPIVGPRARRAACAVCVLLGFLLLLSTAPRRVATFLWPGTYAFLDDYYYVPGLDLKTTNPNGGHTIAAYDMHTVHKSGNRIIGFADGHVMYIPEDRARPLFEAQGIPYPIPDR